MRKLFIIVGLCLILPFVNAFTFPPYEEIKVAAHFPEKTCDMVVGATTNEALEIACLVIQAIHELYIPLSEKLERVGVVGECVGQLGSNMAVRVFYQTDSSIDNGLPLPISLPLAPPVAVPYPGQAN